MTLSDGDRELIVDQLAREPTAEEAALFENLWSEHCAYRSSRPLLGAFESDSEDVVIGPGDDAAAIAVGDDETYLTIGIESHNHPSYVDPYDGAATGVGGIVRDTLSMGAYPIALADSLYFGPFDRQHTRYLLEGVVEGIADYGNAIGVPTVAGSVNFHAGYEGNPLVNVACLGVTTDDRLLEGALTEPGNKLVLVGNGTGRDGLGGASFASDALSEDAKTEDRPAVQVGDPYTEKRLIEVNEALIDNDLVESARDLGAAGLGGATSEMAAQGELGAHVELEQVHQREPGMTPLEILLSESQERMCYEVHPENVPAVQAIAEQYDIGCSVIGEVTTDGYVCTYEDETVVDVPASFVADGAPAYDRERTTSPQPEPDRPTDLDLATTFDTVVGSPNTAAREWVYHQYDHEVGLRTALRPGADAAILTLHEADTGVAISTGAEPHWMAAAPYQGAKAVAVENVTNLAAVGATPIAAVDALNGGTPEDPAVYDEIAQMVDGLATACRELSIPVVGGNVSLYNDSASGSIPPTPTVAMLGTTETYDAPGTTVAPAGEILLLGEHQDKPKLGGSELLAQLGGRDVFPTPPTDLPVDRLTTIATHPDTQAMHDLSIGGLAVGLAELVSRAAGIEIELPGPDPIGQLFHEQAGRLLVQTTAPAEVTEIIGDTMAVRQIGTPTATGDLRIKTESTELTRSADRIQELRATLTTTLD